MLIVSDPPGATAIVNGQNIGPTPASMPYTFYGKYDVTLVRDGFQTKTYAAQKVPWLGDIPILGNLFKSTTNINNKTELLIFITPKILREGSNLY